MIASSIPFDSINYLQSGTECQRDAYRSLTQHRVFQKLSSFTPILAGTIPLSIDVEDSDLDIICCWVNKKNFTETVSEAFGHFPTFQMHEKMLKNLESVVATFRLDDVTIEVFGQNIPVKEQHAYRHLIIEHAILQREGEAFRKEIIRLKKQGLKTEPAFAQLLGLKGDPYEALLNYKVS